MRLVLLTVGKPKSKHLGAGITDYIERLKPYGGGELANVRPFKAGKNTPPAQVMASEGQRLLARLDRRDLVWALDRRGKAWSSK